MIVKHNFVCDHGNPKKKGMKLTLDRGPSGQIDRDEKLIKEISLLIKINKFFIN